jgi:hypothetical protein
MQNISFNTCNINQETNSSGDYFNLILNSIEQVTLIKKDFLFKYFMIMSLTTGLSLK